MIYKLETENSFIEVEAGAIDKTISIYVVSGCPYTINDKFRRDIQLEFSKKNVQELIKSLEFALKDYEQEEAELSLKEK